MRTLLFATTLVTASFAISNIVFADDLNPTGWAERCMKSTKNQLGWVSERERCLDVILAYCEFAEDNQACFLKLAEDFGGRANQLMTDFPVTIDADDAQKGFYDLRLSVLSEMTPEVQCGHEEVRTYCTALTAMKRYLASESLSDWLADQWGKP